MRSSVLPAAALLIFITPVVSAKDNDVAPPPVFQAVLDCKAVSDPTERLTCYDKTVESMAAANRDKELVVADRATMKEARQGLFGLGLPKLKLFGGGDSEEVTEIESTIAAFRAAPDGLMIVQLADGARWKQTDGRPQYPKIGDKIRIRKASLGSFMANINEKPAIRVVRMGN